MILLLFASGVIVFSIPWKFFLLSLSVVSNTQCKALLPTQRGYGDSRLPSLPKWVVLWGMAEGTGGAL